MFSIKNLNPSCTLDPLNALRLRRASATPLPTHRPISFRQSVVTFAASHEESKHSEVDLERENDEESSNEAWKQALEAFKEAYEIYSKLDLVILVALQ
ncbi:hypothetical protein V6N11_054938 [Hibiscus sabdariffa]|uniref:Uncharacterized protein n=1 Tax=Hibiscus sabdariffa TaxID=183260 RepID=A0ABR2P3S2_9ROSI